MNSTDLLPVVTEKQEFLCPLENRTISRALHLSRMAAGHAQCLICEFRDETGLLPRQVVERTRSKGRNVPNGIISPRGLRGLAINQLTRERITELTVHVIQLANRLRHERAQGSVHGGLKVVTGYDSRPSSPDLAIGMVTALKRSGCDVIDLGQVSRPIFDFGAACFRPDVGLFLTGGELPSSWNGMDIIGEDGLPWGWPGRLTELASTLTQPISRIARSSGHYEAVCVDSEYEQQLIQQLHALRPLRLAVVCPEPIQRRILTRIMEQTPCSIHLLTGGGDHPEQATKQIIDTLCQRRLDLGVVFGMDGRSCRIFDEGGHALTLVESLNLLSSIDERLPPESMNRNNEFQSSSINGPHSPLREPWVIRVADEEPIPETVSPARLLSGTEADLLLRQRQGEIPMAADSSFRFWFRDMIPECDALQTLIRIIEVLSLSDRPVSSYRSESHRKRR